MDVLVPVSEAYTDIQACSSPVHYCMPLYACIFTKIVVVVCVVRCIKHIPLETYEIDCVENHIEKYYDCTYSLSLTLAVSVDSSNFVCLALDGSK